MARVLFVTSRLPFPPREGHQLRSWHVLKALAGRHDVTLLSFARSDDDAQGAQEMHRHLAGLETFPIASERSKLALAWALLRSVLTREPFVSAKYASAAMRRRIAKLARDADVVHFDMLPLMRYADAVPAGIPIVYNAHNVEHVLLETRARMHPGWAVKQFLQAQLQRLLAFERRACRRANLVLACSGTDAQQLRTLAPMTRVAIVPNGVDLDGNRPVAAPAGARHKSQLVFVGQMGWFPNRDGVEWFLHDVLPRILIARPEAEFVLVGKADGLEVPADIASHVTLTGFVPDLRPYVHAAAVYVVPLRAGSGTRLKVLEAMALGKAIVTTSIGSEGIVLRDGRSALYADDAVAFANAVVSLLESPPLRRQLGTAARACAESHYGWDAIGLDLLAFYEPLLPDTWVPPPPKTRKYNSILEAAFAPVPVPAPAAGNAPAPLPGHEPLPSVQPASVQATSAQVVAGIDRILDQAAAESTPASTVATTTAQAPAATPRPAPKSRRPRKKASTPPAPEPPASEPPRAAKPRKKAAPRRARGVADPEQR
jgi:polysaccharide biosynthesis protein PslH